MKQNRSLAISNKIQECKMGNIIGMLEREFPASVLSVKNEGVKTRDRVFTINNTILTMVLTSVQQDKTLKNSVDLYYMIHQKRKNEALEGLKQNIQAQKEEDNKLLMKKAGRPKVYNLQMPKSLEKDISLNTAAYSKARERVPLELVKDLFKNSRIEQAENCYSHWYGYQVFSGDGTYIQLQDTESIRKEYEVKHNGLPSDGYPQGLLEVIIERGTGQLYSLKLSNRHTSELLLFYDMLDEMPQKSLLLLDDLYNCFEIFSKCKRLKIEIVVPDKKERNYQVIEKLGQGDEIVSIKTPKNRSKWIEVNEKAGKILLRRIQCKSPEGNDYVLLTTILDKNITKEEIHLLYLTRWDIEIGIREIKTIMDINVLRSKTPDMALKELYVSLSTYNLIRKMIYAGIKDQPFSPEEDLIHQFYTFNQDILIDKKGRVYNRWSTGRKRIESINIETNASEKKTKQKI
ncbi:MAG: IS4 family transposase [Bacteroidetes bacterium]|nr:IS4 family transposase [Bacteroidota bacterium]